MPKLRGVPLFIANRPVLLPLPPPPPSTYSGLFTRPRDPLFEPLDSLLVLPEQAVCVALEMFKDAKAFLVFSIAPSLPFTMIAPITKTSSILFRRD